MLVNIYLHEVTEVKNKTITQLEEAPMMI